MKNKIERLKDWGLNHKLQVVYIIFTLAIALNIILVTQYLQVKKRSLSKKSSAATVQENKFEELSEKGVIEKAHEILEVGLNYKKTSGKEVVAIINATKKNGYFTNTPEEKNQPYELVLLRGNQKLYSRPFKIPNQVIGPPPDPEKSGIETAGKIESNLVELKEVNFIITLPFYSDADKLVIQKSVGVEVASYKLENLNTLKEEIKVDTSKGKVLSLKTDVINTALKVMTVFSSDARAQSQTGFVDVVVLGSGYSGGQIASFKADAKRMTDNLLTYEPFKTRSSQFLFHVIENTSDLGCSYWGRVIVCDTGKVISLINSAGIPHDVVAVIVNNPTYGGSAYYPYNGNPGIATSYNGSQWSNEVFIHEVGHALGLLEDEYLANCSSEPGERNCYKTGSMTSEKWRELTGDGNLIAGCNYSNWSRSTETSIMRAIDARFFNKISQYFLNVAIERYAGNTAVPTPTSMFPTISLFLTPTITHVVSHTPTVTLTPTPRSSSNTNLTVTITPTQTSSSTTNQTSTPTPTLGATSTPTLSPTPKPTNTPTPVFTVTPTTVLNCVRGLTINLESNSHTATRGQTINNNLLITNNNDVGCGPTALLGISYAHPSVWDMTTCAPSVSVNAGETKTCALTIYVKPEAPTGSNIYQTWVSSWGPFNGTINVQ